MDEDVATGGAWGARGRVWVWVTASLGAKIKGSQRTSVKILLKRIFSSNFLATVLSPSSVGGHKRAEGGTGQASAVQGVSEFI